MVAGAVWDILVPQARHTDERCRPKRRAMALTDRELWAVAGGLVLGLLLLLAITGSLATIWTLRQRFADGDAAVGRSRP